MRLTQNLPKTPSLCARPEETPTRCSFCDQPLDKSTFIFLTKRRPYGAICSSCVDKRAVVSQLYKAFSAYYENRSWDSIKEQIWRSLVGEDGSERTKKVVAALALRLAQRSASLGCDVQGEVDPKTNTFLFRPRIALLGKDAASAATLLAAASRVTGLPVHVCRIEDLKSGDAESGLYQKCVMDERILKQAMIFVTDGYEQSHSESAVIYCCENDAGLPAEMHLLRLD